MNNNHLTLEASFTPDSKYVLSGVSPSISHLIPTPSHHHTTPPSHYHTSHHHPPTITHLTPSLPPITSHPYNAGSQDGTVHVWSSETGKKVTVLDGGHPGPTYNVQFNPKLMMAASTCNSVVSPRSSTSYSMAPFPVSSFAFLALLPTTNSYFLFPLTL